MAIRIREEESLFERPLRRPRRGKMVAGVCAGLADWLGWDRTVVRLLFIVTTILAGVFPGLLVYAGLWLVVPEGNVCRTHVWEGWDERDL
jgi:phage shock protein PspC (stress-responsive transcriptional regulator)